MNTNPTTTRIDALNSILAHSKPYAAFVACARAEGYNWATDADLEAFEARVAATLNWAISMPEWGRLWLVAAQQILDGRLAWRDHNTTEVEPEPEVEEISEIDSAPAVDIPTDAGGYFPDEEGEDI